MVLLIVAVAVVVVVTVAMAMAVGPLVVMGRPPQQPPLHRVKKAR